ncbi:unnamed protein product [Nesidiocoris tenuis]|uniref:Uncharacterized protein n=1 Tax=Nesidiocoris tenuis TaxID=355587 RepID=A0A6H5H9D0_9HEMI|nr:unnamed protein product [Nesidiocoris tenuis]
MEGLVPPCNTAVPIAHTDVTQLRYHCGHMSRVPYNSSPAIISVTVAELVRKRKKLKTQQLKNMRTKRGSRGPLSRCRSIRKGSQTPGANAPRKVFIASDIRFIKLRDRLFRVTNSTKQFHNGYCSSSYRRARGSRDVEGGVWSIRARRSGVECTDRQHRHSDPTGNDRPLCKDGNTASFSRPLRLQLGLRLRTNTIISCFESESSVQLALKMILSYIIRKSWTKNYYRDQGQKDVWYFRQNSPPTRPIIEKPKQISHLHHRLFYVFISGKLIGYVKVFKLDRCDDTAFFERFNLLESAAEETTRSPQTFVSAIRKQLVLDIFLPTEPESKDNNQYRHCVGNEPYFQRFGIVYRFRGGGLGCAPNFTACAILFDCFHQWKTPLLQTRGSPPSSGEWSPVDVARPCKRYCVPISYRLMHWIGDRRKDGAKRSTEETGVGADGFIAEDPRQSINLVVEDDAEVRELAEVRISDDAKQSGPLKPPTTEYGAFRRPGMIGRTPQYNRLQGPSQGMGLKADPYDRPEGRLASL